eukprot:3353-Heterococcus_DN1.PRE.7
MSSKTDAGVYIAVHACINSGSRLQECSALCRTLPGLSENFLSRSGHLLSNVSGSVIRVLVICVCTPLQPCHVGPAPAPPAIVCCLDTAVVRIDSITLCDVSTLPPTTAASADGLSTQLAGSTILTGAKQPCAMSKQWCFTMMHEYSKKRRMKVLDC